MEDLTIPESLLKQVRALAAKEGVTVEQFISSALAEKAAAWMTVEYLEKRTAQGKPHNFKKALDNVPDVEPGKQDRLD